MKTVFSAALLALSLTLSFGGTADAAPHCSTGKLCGNACIAKDKECHIPTPAKVCKKGKLCGDTCIAKDKVCSK